MSEDSTACDVGALKNIRSYVNCDANNISNNTSDNMIMFKINDMNYNNNKKSHEEKSYTPRHTPNNHASEIIARSAHELSRINNNINNLKAKVSQIEGN